MAIKHSFTSAVLNTTDAAKVGSTRWNADHLFSMPYGSFSSSVDQTLLDPTKSYPITYNTTDIASGITLSNNSHINILEAGTYLITFSAIGKSNLANKTLDIWLAVDGSPVANSDTVSKFVGSANERVITVTYIYQFTAGQYFELMMWSDDAGTILNATGAAVGPPARPACPSIIVTANKISE